MPKYRVAEIVRLEYIIDSESPSKAVDSYMKEFTSMFTSTKPIETVEGTDFTVNAVNEDGTIGEEVDY